LKIFPTGFYVEPEFLNEEKLDDAIALLKNEIKPLKKTSCCYFEDLFQLTLWVKHNKKSRGYYYTKKREGI